MVKTRPIQDSDNLKKNTQKLNYGKITKGGCRKKKHSPIANQIPKSAFAAYRYDNQVWVFLFDCLFVTAFNNILCLYVDL